MSHSGGGMGGLVLALCLKKYASDSVRFDIYESASELTEVGAGVGMSMRIWSIMRELGLEDDLLTITGTKDRTGRVSLRSSHCARTLLRSRAHCNVGFPFWLRKGDEGQPIDLFRITQGEDSCTLLRWIRRLTGCCFQSVHTFHRSILQQLLANRLDAGDRIHFSKRLASYSETSPTDPIKLNFKDGTTATCDLVIGSDGIRSAVRRTMFNDFAKEAENRGQDEEAARLRSMVDPIWSGHVAYRGLAPASALSEELLQYALVSPQVVSLLYHA